MFLSRHACRKPSRWLSSVVRASFSTTVASSQGRFAITDLSSSSTQGSGPQRHLSTAAASDEDAPAESYPIMYMWGTDTSGSLLKPTDRQDEKKIDVPTLTEDWKKTLSDDESAPNFGVGISKVVCGATDTAWILSNGKCYVAGENKQGQLGQGHKNPVTKPVQVILPTEGVTVKDAALGPSFAAYVDSEGDLYTAGFGGSAFAGLGALGHGDGESQLKPKLVESLVEDGCFVDQVQVGESHMTVLTTEGEVLTTGAGSYGRLGNFDTVDQLYLEPVELLTSASGVIQIAGGKSFTLALTNDGVVYGWGRNHKGQLGTGLGLAVDMYAMQAVPEPIEADELLGRKVTKIAAGHSHAACITAGGELFFWGSSQYLEPYRVTDLLHTQVVDVVCGKDYTLAIDKDGKMYSFGKGKNGCLGQGSTKQANQPTLMEAFGDVQVAVASAGWDHAACLAKE